MSLNSKSLSNQIFPFKTFQIKKILKFLKKKKKTFENKTLFQWDARNIRPRKSSLVEFKDPQVDALPFFLFFFLFFKKVNKNK